MKIEPENSVILNRILSPAVVLAFVTAFLYFTGKLFDRGFFQYWKLNEGMFTRSFQDTLLQSAYALMSFESWKGFAALIAMLMVFGLLLLLNYSFVWFLKLPLGRAIKLWYLKKIRKRRKEQPRNPILDSLKPLFLILGALFIAFYFYFALTLLLSSFGQAIMDAGYENARQLHMELEPNAIPDKLTNRFHAQPINSSEMELSGTLLACTEVRCAIYESSIVRVVNLNSHNLVSK